MAIHKLFIPNLVLSLLCTSIYACVAVFVITLAQRIESLYLRYQNTKSKTIYPKIILCEKRTKSATGKNEEFETRMGINLSALIHKVSPGGERV